MAFFSFGKNREEKIKIGLVTISSETKDNNQKLCSWIKKKIKSQGFSALEKIVLKNEFTDLSAGVTDLIFQETPDAVIVIGGTGLKSRDITIETLSPLFSKTITGFSNAFTILSMESMDSSAVLFRAKAGIINDAAVFCLPENIRLSKLACKALIFPEIENIIQMIRQ